MIVQFSFGGYRQFGTPVPTLPRLRRRYTVPEVQAAVAGFYQIPVSSMLSADRHWEVCHPRQLAMYICRDLMGRSLPEIGRRFGGRDHTTVIHAIKAVTRRLDEDDDVRHDYRRIMARLSA